MADPLRHRQTKGAETAMVSLQPPRHIPTLPKLRLRRKHPMSASTRSRQSAPQRKALLDHLVGAGGQAGRHVKAERLGGCQVDHELEPAGLLDRQVGGLLALENPHDVESSTVIGLWNVVA